jgi:hypothetical protein
LAVLIVIIAWQDFKSRLIHLLLIVIFFLSNSVYYLTLNGWQQLIENFLFCTGYLAFNFLVIWLYYFVKKKQGEEIIDKKIGWGDIAVFLSIGICMEPLTMIWFFTGSFMLSLLLFCLFITKDSVPLAGFTVLFYLLYLIYLIAGSTLEWPGIS